MSSVDLLKEIGINPGNDLMHQYVEGARHVDPVEHYEISKALLTTARPIAEHVMVNQLDEFADRWHPGGYMVFALGVHSTHGSVRMHVWPKGIERESSTGPNIHSQAWHTGSLVLEGVYSDAVYDVRAPRQRDDEPSDDEYVFYSQRRLEDAEDELTEEGQLVEAVQLGERRVPKGHLHMVVAGEYQLPTIPKDINVATLVLASPAFRSTTGVLMRDKSGTISRERRPITVADLGLAKGILLNQSEPATN